MILERSSGGIICLRELTCGNERWLLQLHAGQSLLVVEHAGLKMAAAPLVFSMVGLFGSCCMAPGGKA